VKDESSWDFNHVWNWSWRDWWYDDDKTELKETYVMQGDQMVPVPAPRPHSAEARMGIAREAFRVQDYGKAERVFHRVADNEKNPPKLVEEAKFYEAESLRLQEDYPKAADTYADLMNKFPRNPYREQALQRMYEIADEWLQDTRTEMREYEEKEQGKRWVVWPRFISFERKKPFFDREGRAIQLLDQVRYGEINGPLADKSMFVCGSIKFFNEDFREADDYFTQVAEKSKDREMAEKAMKLAIIAKHMSTGGSDYDGRKCAEARILVQRALNSPGLTPENKNWLDGELMGISAQQAEKDLKMGEFYQRTGHPASAVFYYELVVRRYPNTEYAQKAATQRDELLAKIQRDPAIAQETPVPTVPRNGNRSPEQAPTPRVLPPDLAAPGR
jgi:outer membrane protein assembly factor BamD (BamD/ComL family)